MTTGFAFSFLERCIKESFATRRFGKPEMKQVIGELSPESPQCVYCGSADLRRWDHLYPVAVGGDTVVGNMVPACSRCDDSKQDLPYRQWVLSAARYSPMSQGVRDLESRLARIDAYVASPSYSPRPIEQRLLEDEARELANIRKRAVELRNELDQLINKYRTQTGEP
jgi:hypothetical protein